jgi:drug/metabolite transporter (DMT)-like permease
MCWSFGPLQYLTAAKACFIYSLSPFFAAFFSYLHFGEKINKTKAIGLMVGFLGIIPVLTLQTGAEDLMSAFSFFSWPTLAIIGAAMSSVYGWVLLRLLVKDQTTSPTMANGGSMLIGGLLAFSHSALTDTWQPTPIAIGSFTPFFGWTLLMAFISNIVCYNLYGFLLKKYTATFLLSLACSARSSLPSMDGFSWENRFPE